ncbi:MFS transporter [Pseudoclavibacter sp. RFBJ3]|uniref:class I SAM-dependent methyltransferase n=1 Tax=unclassified Pseudoclavibacter TaxID=2615177 RepID=UPI000CE81213|nr:MULTISPECIES: methyltransferase [unclassified Pseudoclavibacter]PPF34058.1 MFS transporter [Pseudoclavibacter sp. AY1H1]PPF76723.1 MFS transporter [Pseudoclavibacter sp. Z016]PPF85307.1 MFS transporter [Pseudoclavibacter sp. RFBJ5]PPF93298.1 MFS transporter [Pseudoclavibacter sp. RFBJ3]PPF98944.1 MFS transporter [Pseudoclavibacter sp. RFBH5]
MTAQHYFSATPDGPLERRRVVANLRGRTVTVITAGGTFSPEHVDRGTQALLHAAPPPPSTGTALDLGCGWGPIALALALESPELDVRAVDVNERALLLTGENAQALGLDNITPTRPEDVPEDTTFDLIWSNPPIRIGKEALHELLSAWLPRLSAEGEAWLVVAKKLGGDSLQSWIAAQFGPELSVERHSTDAGFRVLRVRRVR